MVYIDGTWVDAHIDIKQNTWTRIDTTFAAGSGSSYVGDGIAYTEPLHVLIMTIHVAARDKRSA